MKNKKLYSKNINFYEILFCLFFFIAQTYIAIFSPIMGDDTFNSNLKGSYLLLDKNIFEIVYIYIRDWLVTNGRIHFSIPPLTVLFFEFFNTVLSIKIAHYFINFITIISFLYFIYLSSNRNLIFTFFSLIILPIFFQFRDWHDPFLMFPTHYNILVLFFFLSLSFFLIYLNSNQKKYFIFSIILYILACGTFEPAIFLSLLYVYYDFRKNSKIKYSYSFVSVSIIFLLSIIYFRYFHQIIFGPMESILFSKDGGYDGSQISFDLLKSSLTIFLQFIGSLPLIFFFKNQTLNFNLIDLLVFFSFGFFVFHFLNKFSKILFLNINFLQYFFLNLIIFLSLTPIGLSGKYIVDLPKKGIGYAHLPVYLQYFGVSLLFLFLIYKILNSQFKFRIHLIAILISLIGFFNFASNKNIIYETMHPKKIIRDNVAKSLKAGLLDNVDNFSNIVFWETKYHLWKSPEFVATHSKKKIFTQYSYDTSFFDLYLDNKQEKILFKNKDLFKIDKLEVRKTNNKFNFLKSSHQFDNLNKQININENDREKIFENSDKVYILLNLPNFEDNRVLLANISSFNVDEDNRIKELFSNEIYFYSEKNKIFSINLNFEINLNNFLSDYDPQNPKTSFNKSDIISFIKSKKLIKINKEKLIVKKKEMKNSFFSGELFCNKETINITNYPQNYFGLINTDYEYIKFRLYNYSNSLWEINNFVESNPITLRSYLKNSKTNNTIAGINLSNKKLKIESGEYKEFNLNFNEMIELRSFLINKKKFDTITFSLIKEGERWFPENEFKSCDLSIDRD
tara:strand:- start:2587 stop:4965 length:2379 start_codon:yes stop_codon:yes gene_type:complete